MTVRVGAFELTEEGRRPLGLARPVSLPGRSQRGPSSWHRVHRGRDRAERSVRRVLHDRTPGSIANLPPGSFLLAFSFSLETLATVGYGVMAPLSAYGHAVSAIEIVTRRVVHRHRHRPDLRSLLAPARGGDPPPSRSGRRPARRRVDADGADRQRPAQAAGRRAGRECSRRWSSINTREGNLLRSSVDLPLLRSRIANFALTWTLMHRIDEASPLYGLTPDEHRRARSCGSTRRSRRAIRCWPTVIHTMLDWGPEQVLFGMRYADAVSTDEQGRTDRRSAADQRRRDGRRYRRRTKPSMLRGRGRIAGGVGLNGPAGPRESTAEWPRTTIGNVGFNGRRDTSPGSHRIRPPTTATLERRNSAY